MNEKLNYEKLDLALNILFTSLLHNRERDDSETLSYIITTPIVNRIMQMDEFSGIDSVGRVIINQAAICMLNYFNPRILNPCLSHGTRDFTEYCILTEYDQRYDGNNASAWHRRQSGAGSALIHQAVMCWLNNKLKRN